MPAVAAALHAIRTQPYRLFFLGAGAYAALHVGLWTLLLTRGIGPAPPNPMFWHGYEMVFGYAGAVVTGFVLTAAANWTNRKTVTPGVLALLFTAWCTARIGGFAGVSPWIILVADGIVLWGLFAALARVLIITGNRRNYRFLPIIGLFAAAASLIQLAAAGVIPDWRMALLHAAVDLLLILMVIMGGRVIPFFTRQRLPLLNVEDPEWLGRCASGLVVLAVIAYWLLPDNVAAAAAWFSACFVLARLAHWSPLGTRGEPMLWILHVGYLWLAIALFLRGGALAWDWMPLPTALHAVMVGALGCLTLGMMSRVALGHGGHPMRAPTWLVPAFVLVGLAALPRLLSAWPALVDGRFAFTLAGGAWFIAFALYVAVLAPVLLGPRRRAEP